MSKMEQHAAQIALDWMNGEEVDVVTGLNRYSGASAALMGLLVYKELERASKQVCVDAPAFLTWLKDNVMA